MRMLAGYINQAHRYLRKNGAPVATIEGGDSVIFANFRRTVLEITRARLIFDGFYTQKQVFPAQVCQHDAVRCDLADKLEVAFKPEAAEKTRWANTSRKLPPKRSCACETEKYAHGTFFFNGGVEKPGRR